MKIMIFRRFAALFWLLVLIDLAAVFFGIKWLGYSAKPLLMPALAMLVLFYNEKTSNKQLILAGLFFSWLGDIFLLAEFPGMLFFIAGLLSFLITHACYIIHFLSLKSEAPSFLKKRPLFILLIICYGTGLVWFLFLYLGGLKIPVILYSAVICSMLICSIHIYLKVRNPANRYYVAGAALFVLSDSILAVNKFYQPLPLAGICLMLSYCAAQYFIVLGFIEPGVRVK